MLKWLSQLFDNILSFSSSIFSSCVSFISGIFTSGPEVSTQEEVSFISTTLYEHYRPYINWYECKDVSFISAMLYRHYINYKDRAAKDGDQNIKEQFIKELIADFDKNEPIHNIIGSICDERIKGKKPEERENIESAIKRDLAVIFVDLLDYQYGWYGLEFYAEEALYSKLTRTADKELQYKRK